MGKIIALDIGVSSVGWAVVDNETGEVLESCSNIFPEATAASNQERRSFRQTRRLHRRKKTRLDDFKKLWETTGSTVEKSNETDLCCVKVRALTERVTEEQLFAILYAALKNRGISYLEDADDGSTGSGNYAQALALNQEEIKKKFPCQIQLERLVGYGKYRGQSEYTLEDGTKITINNVFTIGAYRREIIAILEKQKEFHPFLTDEFVDAYLLIFNRKRKYYEGPGNELSRTDYGKYTTKIDQTTGEYITEENIFEKLIGRCSVYPEELRASAASYTAQEFNLLNDLNNLTINGRKLEEKEKRLIVQTVLTSNSINMKKIIGKVIGESVEEWSGARVDKNDKEIFHTFSAYNKMRKALESIDADITRFTREDLDEIGHILTINTDKDSILTAFENSPIILSNEEKECLVGVRKKNGADFNKWHSFSLRIMNELIPELYAQPKEQMTLLTEIGAFKSKTDEYKGLKYIPVDDVCEEILNPVVRRSVRVSARVINALIRKYGTISDIVIEMPRDRNSDEEKKREADRNKKNANEINAVEKKLALSYDLVIDKSEYSHHKQLGLKLKLWNEQDGICLYSGKTINPIDIVKHPEMFEIDHIIPRSISFDDSRTNKVLTYHDENQKKGNHTPYYYLTHISSGNWTYDHFKAKVIELSKKKEYGLSRKKVENLLFDKDITKIEVMRGFISRNLNDTRYASRVVLNSLQSFFKAQEEDTRVKVIRGAYTHQMRVNMKLDKNREESYTHHAVDAMLIAFSQMGYESYRKLQGSFIDFETGEILDQRMYDTNMSDEVYKDYLYGKKWAQIRQTISEEEKNVKFWHRVDKKCNRGLCNQTIRGTREYDGKVYKINKFDIRSKEGAALFQKLAFDDEERERLLVYKNDRQTFENLVQIFQDYSDAVNPFVQYEKETGDLVRKYAKRHNGPKIETLKYTDGEVNSCIDISHKYGHEKGSKKVFLESLNPYRMDVYYREDEKLYYFVGIKQSDIKCQGDKHIIDEEAYKVALLNEKMIQENQTREDLAELGYTFVMSFYKNEIIEYEKGGEIFRERFLSRTMPKNRNYIETKPIEKAKAEKRVPVGLAKTTHVAKIRLDILGEQYYCTKEEFSRYC